MRPNVFILLIFLLLPTVSSAFFCPTNFNQIYYGQTPDQVMQQCGKPDVQQNSVEKPEGPQQWEYLIPQTVTNRALQSVQGTVKTEIIFDANGQAVNISVNGIGVGATTICGTQIQLGDTREAVKKACGQPSFVNKQNGNSAALGSPPPAKKITLFIYKTNPPLTLKFVNGVLESKQ